MWIGLGLVTVWAVRIYYVQELLVALMVFSLLFVAVSMAVFAIFLLLRASRPIILWAIPKVRRLLHRGAETVVEGIATPVWARTLPHHLRRHHLKLNDKYRALHLRFAVLRPKHLCMIGSRLGGEALTIGLSHQKRMSKRLGKWLTQRVGYSDLIHLASRFHVRPSPGRRRPTAPR